ncbi:MAG: MSCRAMM family adhesin SdrC [Lachnospiraceae bacterium]|nr:MSCRAMM family adhesin SdrC [Lachnospiraceae bacterium]
MKKKYLAIILGMALSLTSVCAFAEEETDAQEDVVIVEETEEEELTGRIESINDDGSLVISVGDWEEDTSDESIGTLTLSGEEVEAAFADDISAVSLIDYKTITVVEAEAEEDTDAAEDSGTEEEAADTDTAEEGTDSEAADTADEDAEEADAAVSDEDADGEDADAESTDTEDIESVETEEMDTSDLQIGDIITFTMNEDGAIDTLTLISAASDEEADAEENADTAEEEADDAESDGEA